jgi:hypothetical protein
MMNNLAPDGTGKVHSRSRLQREGTETKNFVPVDWVSAVTAHIITRPEHHGRTYHLTPQHPVDHRLASGVLEELNNFYAIEFCGVRGITDDWTEYEQLFYDLMQVYDSYWRDDPQFDTTNTRAAAPHLPCPHVDRSLLLMLGRKAIEVQFSAPKFKVPEPDFDLERHLQPWLDSAEGAAGNARQPGLGLRVTGHGGGEWQVMLKEGAVVGASVGLHPRSLATCRLDVRSFAALAHGEATAEELVARGAVAIAGEGLSGPEVSRALEALAAGP